VAERNNPAYHFSEAKEQQRRKGKQTMAEELRDQARALGLDRLTKEQLAQFERATNGMERHLQRLPRRMPVVREPAHVYRAKGETR
jgi:hypothetical protein